MVDFEVNITMYGGELRMKYPQGQTTYQAHSVSDVEASRSFDKLKQEMPRYRKMLCLPPKAPAYLAELRLPEQNIGDRATRALVEALLFGSVRCAEVYLYKCVLGDASAQALACLVENSPAPGVTGLHLSHNYISPIGVKLIIDAVRRCKMYPQKLNIGRFNKTSHTPLWLRVDHQFVPWPGYDNKEEIEKLELTEKRIEELSALLLSKSQAEGSIPNDFMPWETPRLICVPAPKGTQRLEYFDPSNTDGMAEFDECAQCGVHRCKFASPYGPLVHLPYFWLQGNGSWPKWQLERWGASQEPPEAASLHLRERHWKSWFPRIPRTRAAQPQLALEAPSKPVLQNGAPPVKREENTPVKVESEAVVQPKKETPLPASLVKQEKPPKDKKIKKEKKEKKKEKKDEKKKKKEAAAAMQAVEKQLEAVVATQVARAADEQLGSDDNEVDEVEMEQPVSNFVKRKRTKLPEVPEPQVSDVEENIAESPEEELEEEFEFVPKLGQTEEDAPEDDEELEFVD